MLLRSTLGVLAAVLLAAAPAEAQRLACGGHRIDWAGGAPTVRSLEGVDSDVDSDGIRMHDDGKPPTESEPASVNRARWDELVFDAHDRPGSRPPFGAQLRQRQTLTIDRRVVPEIKICVQSSDAGDTGKRLERYATASWWRRQIERWTGLNWSGELRVDACTGTVPAGWIYVRDGGGGQGNVLAYTSSRREYHPHGDGRWIASDILWNPQAAADIDEAYFESALAHELGHALGFFHVSPGSGYVMVKGLTGTFPEEESSLAQLAYRVGPGVRYPGLVRDDAGGSGEDPEDRRALMALYDQAGGRSWATSTNWGTDAKLDRWYGVETGDAGRVTEVNLHVNELTGTIPSELDGLSSLKSLILDKNDLSGRIPAALGGLSGLEFLNFESNSLSGPIPAELGGLANLEWLELGRNDLTGAIPARLADLSRLELLSLQYNNLTGTIPPALGRLSSLKQLRLSSAGLSGAIPGELGGISSLLSLELENNALTGTIPSSLGGLSALLSLALNDNNLSGSVPPELGGLSALETLHLQENNLTGALPSSLMDLRRLKVLDISGNAGLCAPADAAFQAWLATIIEFSGPTCATVPVLPAAGLLVTGLLLGGLGVRIVRRRRPGQSGGQQRQAV